jgi:hypothetical protein
MNNTWIVVPVKDNGIDASPVVENLTGGFVAPEKYGVESVNVQDMGPEREWIDHPYFGQDAPNFSGRIVFINFEKNHQVFDGVTHILDDSGVSIYRAWNTGLEYAISNGADSVVLFNAITDFDPFTVIQAKLIMDESEAEVINIWDGAMIMISGTSKIRADEQFRIWCGDNDLYLRAAGVTEKCWDVFGKFEHLEDWFGFENFEEIVAEDLSRYGAKHG